MQEHGRRLTLTEIAREANVSASTLSLVLNDRPGVGERKRAELKELLRRLGYERSARGRPAASKSGTLAFIVYDRTDIEASHNPFFAEIQRGIEKEAQRQGYGLRVTYVSEGDDIESVLHKLMKYETDGIILDASVMPAAELRRFISPTLPIVVIDQQFPEFEVDTVLIDNVGGARSAVSHLIALGHQKIGLLSSNISNRNFEERERTCIAAMQTEGLEYDDRYTTRVRPRQNDAYEDARRLIGEATQLPTAFFATNDIIAVGAMRALNETGFSVPRDISIVGFDDLPYVDHLNPRLTTVRVFKERMALLAVRRLVERIETDPPERVVLRIGTKLIVRDSVGPPRADA